MDNARDKLAWRELVQTTTTLGQVCARLYTGDIRDSDMAAAAA